MQSITIILSSQCAKIICKFLEKRPVKVFKMLQKGVMDRSLAAICEGSCDISTLQERGNIVDEDIIYLVLKIKFANAFRSANSESIWRCIGKFACKEVGKFSVKRYQNYQVIQFDNDILMQ